MNQPPEIVLSQWPEFKPMRCHFRGGKFFPFERWGFVACFLFFFLTGRAVDAEGMEFGRFLCVTNISQLYDAAAKESGSIIAYDLRETVLDANTNLGTFSVQDGSGAGLLETTLVGQPLQSGRQIRLRGTNFITVSKLAVTLGKVPLIDNDGLHPESEIGSSVYLNEGLYPIQVRWFNYTLGRALWLDYAGPNFERRPVPASVLFRPIQPTPDGSVRFLPGLNFRCYEGEFQVLPDFNRLSPRKSGTCSNFDLSVKTREDYVAMVYNGLIQIRTNGLYTFYLRSDDGSQLDLQNSAVLLDVLGSTNLALPRQWDSTRRADRPFWTAAEGTITFLGRIPEGLFVELKTDAGSVRVMIQDANLQSPEHLLGSRVVVHGLCFHPWDGQISPSTEMDTIVALSGSDVHVVELSPQAWTALAPTNIKPYRESNGPGKPAVVLLQGHFRDDPMGASAVLTDATGAVAVDLANSPVPPLGTEVDCLGIWSRAGTNDILRWAVWRPVTDTSVAAEPPPLLTTAAQIQQLTRAESRKRYPAVIRGVVTWVGPEKNDLVVQDFTRGVYARLRDQHSPAVGEMCQIEGFTELGEFSPILTISNVIRIGVGAMPEPYHPTLDELLKGSMDSQYGEIRGYVTDARDRHLTVLMPGGKIDIQFKPGPIDDLNSLVHAVVRIRGCMFAQWDAKTLLVTPDHPLWFGNATICVDVPPSSNPFEAGSMHAWELMQFNAWANFFQRVKVFGQVLACGQEVYYCTDDGFGFRCKPAASAALLPGDTFEAAGFVELGGDSPLIHEAVIRKTGHAPLPAAQPFVFGGTNALRDATRISVQGMLLEAKRGEAQQVLQIQSGTRTFAARVRRVEPAEGQWKVDSTLKLTGLFSGTKSRETAGTENFGELIVNSPEDVVVLTMPPWWTLNRLLGIAGFLALSLILTFLWITLLRSQVRRRTLELKRETEQRRKVEQARAIEQERARIAQDLHDDLGSRTTAISMLAVAGAENTIAQAAAKERFGTILDHSRSLVAALDELVWAVNPKYDTIKALVDYLAGVAEELLTETGVARHIELPPNIPERSIPADVRHNVLLAANEALNNAIRHGHPSKVLLQMTVAGDELEILIRDNGCGFDPGRAVAGDGLINIGQRMSKVGGRYRIESKPGQGASVYLVLPL